MKTARRKVTLNLMPMLDLMLIVIFAQFLAMRDQTQHEEARAAQDISEVEVTRATLAEERREAELIADKALNQRDLVGQLASELFNLPDETVAKLLRQRFTDDDPPSEEEIAAIQEEFRRLKGRRGQEIVKHLMTFNEIRKRCEVWELHVADSGLTTLKTPGEQTEFRAETPAAFATKLASFRTRKESKNLVLVLLTYGDVTAPIYEAALTGLPLAIERMQLEAAGRTRFEYGVLGIEPKRSNER
ncbi:hypothetical protein LBMAG52_02770 [Planctomycetia bacterium]|nr:hypothetical protein LBMAG52_02770 [Planctomycetia bacterium]